MTVMSCNETRAILTEVPLDTSCDHTNQPPADIWAAELHYAKCPHCRPMGLAEIRGQPLSCQEAVQTAIAGVALLYDIGECATLKEVLAHEHLYGVHLIRERDGWVQPPQYGDGIEKACREEVCTKIRGIWNSAPLCSHYDGDQELEHGIEWALTIAQKAGWDIAPLVATAPISKLGRFNQLQLAF